jgi:hypothetical protein
MTDLRAETLKVIRRELGDRFPDEDQSNPAALDEYAQGLQAIAIAFDVPIIGTEGLIFWIHDRYEAKDWSLAAWRLWCDRYADLRNELEKPRMCQRCFANPVTLTKAGVWWCGKCGEVEG